MTTIRERSFRLTNEIGLPIRCDLRLPPGDGPFPVVVILHGFKGFKDWGMFPPTGRALAARGIATVALNVSRNGVEEELTEFTDLEAFSHNTTGREILDVDCVLAAITAGAVDGSIDADRLGLLGHSRGGGVVLLVAGADPRVHCVVTWSSIATFFRYTERAVGDWRQRGRLDVPNARTGQMMWLSLDVLEDLEAHREEYDIERACERLRSPLLVVHGEVDEAVDVREADRIVGWAKGTETRKVIVPRAGHTFGASHPWAGSTPAWEAAVRETGDWFSRWLGGS